MAPVVQLEWSLPHTFYWCIPQRFALGEWRCHLTHLPLSLSLAGFICTPGSAADKWAAPWLWCFLQSTHRGNSMVTCPVRGSLQGQEGLIFLLWGLFDTYVNCKRVAYFSMVRIRPYSSLGENPTPCFISSGKNATSVQKQPKTLYEWNPLNYNISEFPKAVNRISGIVEEVLNTYIQTHRLFVSGSCSSEHVIRPGILFAWCCSLVPRKCCSAGRRRENCAIWHCWAVFRCVSQ